jgi:hypothetical protein
MIRTPYSVFLTLLITFFSYFQTCEDIAFDYPSHPYHPFDIEHAEITLDLESEQHLVNGQVIYSIQSKVNFLSEIQLHASKLSIDDVSINDKEAEFEISDEKFIIQLPDTLNAGDDFNLTISWQGNSEFGLHKSYDGSFWSSLNPLSHRHWLPGFDHPREAFTFETSIDIPNDKEVLFNGDLGETSPVSQTKKRVRWSSEIEVPATGLGFVLGEFQISEMTAGFTKVRLFHHPTDQQTAADLIVEAARLKKEIEDVLSFQYPWEALNIVILSDNNWMERTHGTGTIYLFERLGNLENQLARNMYAQWFGEYQRTEQYLNLENEGENGLLATALHFQFMDSASQIDNPDSLILIEDWNRWQAGYSQESEDFKTTIEESLEGFTRTFKGIIDFDDYAEVWYQKTGIPNFNPTPISISEVGEVADTLAQYDLSIELDETESELTLILELIEGSGNELQSLNMIMHQFDAVSSEEITFTGNQDTLSISIPNTTEFVTFESAQSIAENVQIKSAPLYYLLNQLRSEKPENRITAAKILVNHSDNPDLQLALNDILSFEENDEVIAAIYLSLSEIADGATGTEEQFIAGLSNPSEAIQLASITALSNYPDNEFVRSSLSSKIIRSEGDLFETAFSVMNAIGTQNEFESILRSVNRRDTVGTKTLSLIEVADSLQTSELALQIADQFTSNENPFSVRKQALEWLNLHDIDSERWNDRLNLLLSDRDPRVRFWAVEIIPRYNSESESLVLLNSAEVDEMDPRVRLMIEGVKEELAE